MQSRQSTNRHRPPLVAPSEEMRAWAAALEEELLTWPQVSIKPMFGFRAAYRGKRIFAALPRTRALVGSNLVEFKLQPPLKRLAEKAARDPRVHISSMSRAGWASFELTKHADLRGALEWLDEAWRAAEKREKVKRKKAKQQR